MSDKPKRITATDYRDIFDALYNKAKELSEERYGNFYHFVWFFSADPIPCRHPKNEVRRCPNGDKVAKFPQWSGIWHRPIFSSIHHFFPESCLGMNKNSTVICLHRDSGSHQECNYYLTTHRVGFRPFKKK